MTATHGWGEVRRHSVQARQRGRADNHPIYAARGNEHALLQDLIAADPPVGGIAAYLSDLDRQAPDCPPSPTEGKL